MSIRVCTYNILADSYILPERYPDADVAELAGGRRTPRLIQRILGLEADLLCLQEVESGAFARLESELARHGHSGHFEKKRGARPDGCAIFFRPGRMTLLETHRLDYSERLARSPSGHIAQLALFEVGGRRLGVANTHLKWDPPQTPPSEQYGYRQLIELLSALSPDSCRKIPWILCGDFNAQPSSGLVKTLLEAGWSYSHSCHPGTATCNSNREAKMIDFIFFRAPLAASPIPLPPISDTTPLPNPTEPSDHVPVVADFEWAG